MTWRLLFLRTQLWRPLAVAVFMGGVQEGSFSRPMVEVVDVGATVSVAVVVAVVMVVAIPFPVAGVIVAMFVVVALAVPVAPVSAKRGRGSSRGPLPSWLW